LVRVGAIFFNSILPHPCGRGTGVERSCLRLCNWEGAGGEASMLMKKRLVTRLASGALLKTAGTSAIQVKKQTKMELTLIGAVMINPQQFDILKERRKESSKFKVQSSRFEELEKSITPKSPKGDFKNAVIIRAFPLGVTGSPKTEAHALSGLEPLSA